MTSSTDDPRDDEPRPREWRKLIDLDGDTIPDAEDDIEPCNCSRDGPCPDDDLFAARCYRRLNPDWRERSVT